MYNQTFDAFLIAETYGRLGLLIKRSYRAIPSQMFVSYIYYIYRCLIQFHIHMSYLHIHIHILHIHVSYMYYITICNRQTNGNISLKLPYSYVALQVHTAFYRFFLFQKIKILTNNCIDWGGGILKPRVLISNVLALIWVYWQISKQVQIKKNTWKHLTLYI